MKLIHAFDQRCYKTIEIFLLEIFHKRLLKKFNFGLPETLNKILVLKLKIKNKINGKLVIKCITKYLGSFSIKVFFSFQKHLRNITKKENSTFKKTIFW